MRRELHARKRWRCTLAFASEPLP